VWLGPFELGGSDYRDGKLMELWAVPAAESGDIDWSVYVGETFESVQDATAFASGTWDVDALNYKERPVARGKAFMVKISNGETDKRWALERMDAVTEMAGPQKKG